jgi:hypothetical protein
MEGMKKRRTNSPEMPIITRTEIPGQSGLEGRLARTEEKGEQMNAEGLKEMVRGLQPEADETHEDQRVQRADHGSARDDAGLEHDFLDGAQQAIAELIRAHAVRRAGHHKAQLRRQFPRRDRRRHGNESEQ